VKEMAIPLETGHPIFTINGKSHPLREISRKEMEQANK